MLMTQGPFRIDPAYRRETERLIESGLLTRLVADVVTVDGPARSRPRRAAALALVVPSRVVAAGAVVSYRAAAWYWRGGPGPDRVDVTVRPGGPRLPVGDPVVVHQRRLESAHVRPLDGAAAVSVTDPIRTAADLLCTLPDREALTELAALTAATRLDPALVARCLNRMSRIRGLLRARELARRPIDAIGPGPPPGAWAPRSVTSSGVPEPDPRDRPRDRPRDDPRHAAAGGTGCGS
jgi:hypothetical protein